MTPDGRVCGVGTRRCLLCCVLQLQPLAVPCMTWYILCVQRCNLHAMTREQKHQRNPRQRRTLVQHHVSALWKQYERYMPKVSAPNETGHSLTTLGCQSLHSRQRHLESSCPVTLRNSLSPSGSRKWKSHRCPQQRAVHCTASNHGRGPSDQKLIHDPGT